MKLGFQNTVSYKRRVLDKYPEARWIDGVRGRYGSIYSGREELSIGLHLSPKKAWKSAYIRSVKGSKGDKLKWSPPYYPKPKRIPPKKQCMITPAKRTAFFNTVRLTVYNGKLSQGQVDGMSVILNEWNERDYCDLRRLAYVLATVHHETAKTMLPIEEYGKGRGRRYGSKIKMSGARYTTPDKIYYGRGYVQLTWYENYEKMGKLLGLPLLTQPELLLKAEVSVKVLFEGMFTALSAKGDFTGKSLEMYFNDKTEDPINARRIINGTDKAELITGYYRKFLIALS